MIKTADLLALSRSRTPHAQEYYDGLIFDPDPLGGYRLRPNQRLAHVSINEDGYRGAPWTGAETILLLGDSVTFGIGASGDEACFARALEAHTGARVADASVRAYRAFQHYLQLPRLLERLPHVRHVLLWCGYADLSYWVMTGGCVEGAFQFEWKYRPGAVQHPLAMRGWRYRLRMAQLAPIVHRWLVGATPAVARDHGTLEQLTTHVAAYIRGIEDICVARRIRLIALIQPFVRVRPTEETFRTFMDLCDQKTREKCGRSWYQLAPQLVEALQYRLAASRGLQVVDCQQFVSEEQFLDQAHLSEDAMRRIAMSLAVDQSLWEALELVSQPRRIHEGTI